MSEYNGAKPIAGEIKTEVITASIDTYYEGMPLKYGSTPTAAVTGTGTGTCTSLSADKNVVPGAWTLDFSAALVADLKDPDGVSVGTYAIISGTGSVTVIKYKGLCFSITVASTAFDATTLVTITVPSTGEFAYDADEPEVIAWENKTLAAAGLLLVASIGSEILGSGLVDGSNSALTVTMALINKARANGLILR